MELDHDICYRALRTRDQRFDGRFFTGVTSTGIYCRPICPARTPRARNCVFFSCAAAAEEAGFRACQRCRPETAPGTPAWRGTSATVSRALRLIKDGALDHGGVADLAGRLGVGDRHLRRLFARQIGASPLAVAHTRRAHFAKRLIEETRLPMAQIAFTAGFRTVRRFNAAVRRSFDRTPTAIRRDTRPVRQTGDRRTRDDRSRRGRQHDDPPRNDGVITLRLAYRPPFDWQAMLAYLGPRAIPGVELVDGGCYYRTVAVGDFAGTIAVTRDPLGESALLLRTPNAAAPHLALLVDRIRTLFDLDADPAAIFDQLDSEQSASDRLAAAARRYPGTRVPGCWNRFELAMRAVLGQQVSVAAATRLAGRLARRFGRQLAVGNAVTHSATAPPSLPSVLFPRPADLAQATIDDIAGIGLPGRRAATIRDLARAVRDGQPVLELASGLDESVQRLTALPGIGDWTAHYIAMRALKEPDAFPAGDLGVRKALAGADDETLPSLATVRRLAEAWRPWRAYATVLLWRSLEVNTK